jgi:hypothetical protein
MAEPEEKEKKKKEETEDTVLIFVMAGLVPAIHALSAERIKDVDARHKAGHDAGESVRLPHHSRPL